MELTNNFMNYLLAKPIENFAVYSNPLSNLAKDWKIVAENPYLFNQEIQYDFKITDQKSSGRCWLFATLNLVRFIAGQTWCDEMDVKDLEFSQSYLYFWDKFERYNQYLNYFQDINELEGDNKCHHFTNICKDPLGDGGQWDMAKEIVDKYGIVPKYVYPDSYHAKSSAPMNKILTEMLKQDWVTLSKTVHSERPELIKKQMEKVFEILVSFLGKPPTKFNFEFKYKNKTKTWKDITPKELLEKSGFKPQDFVSVVHDPRKEHAYNKYYQIQYLGNVKSQHVGWLNLPMERMKELASESITKNQPVWFGCDVGATFDRETGVHDPNIFDLKTFMSYENNMSKEERLSTFLSLPSHAMIIVGYHEDNGNIKRWKIENSWGKTSGTDGFQLMTNDWFNEYVFQIIIHKSKLFDSEKELLSTDPLIVPPWDPLGTLAKKIDNLII